jgi:hypothetical protein
VIVKLAAVSLVLAVGVACTGGSNSTSLTDDAQAVVRNIFSGHYSQVRAEFDDAMTKRLSITQLGAARTTYEETFGTFQGTGKPDVLQLGNDTVVNIPLHMSQKEGQARVTYDVNGRIAGLFLLRTDVRSQSGPT